MTAATRIEMPINLSRILLLMAVVEYAVVVVTNGRIDLSTSACTFVFAAILVRGLGILKNFWLSVVVYTAFLLLTLQIWSTAYQLMNFLITVPNENIHKYKVAIIKTILQYQSLCVLVFILLNDNIDETDTEVQRVRAEHDQTPPPLYDECTLPSYAEATTPPHPDEENIQ